MPTEEAAFGGDASECTNDMLGFSVSYPDEWWANEAIDADDPVADVPGCTYFAPSEVTIEPGTDDLAGIAIRFEQSSTDLDPSGDVLSQDTVTVDGREATRIEYQPMPQRGFIPEGSHITAYVIPTGDDYLIARTDDIQQDSATYAESQEVLAEMMETLELGE